MLPCRFLFCIFIVVLTENVIRGLCCSVLQGPNHTHSGDGHDKLMGFMNSTFPLAVYGLQDAYSGYILYLKLWILNSDPKIIRRWYLQHLYESKGEICTPCWIHFFCHDGAGFLRIRRSHSAHTSQLLENRRNYFIITLHV